MNARTTSLVLTAALLFACKHVPTDKEMQGSQIHYDLGIQAQTAGDLQGAYREYQEALRLDPKFPEAHNAIALVLQLTFKRYDDAVKHFKEALEIRPAFAEAKVNLANLHAEQGRYDDAIPLYEAVLNDILYLTPFIAQANLGWALYKKGDVKRGLEYLKSSVTTNPKFCLGFRNLGIVYGEQNQPEDSCKYFTKYQAACPEAAEAHFRAGVCQLKLGRNELAKKSFEECQARPATDELKDDCRKYAEGLK